MIGGDTIPTGMSALFFYLARNQRCYRKLAEEIRTTFKISSQIRNGSQLAGADLRMSPPITGTLWRQQVVTPEEASEPLIIDGHTIPTGTQIGVNTYSLHHNEEYFPRPFTYLPERWLPDCPEYQTTNRNAFAAFSVGARGCAGKPMAYLEASLVIAKTLWYFDFEELTRAEANEYQLNDIVVSTHKGPWLKFTPRPERIAELHMMKN
ncbi:cytochrome P450 [Nemania sp. FL0916]|nr:cytochrome P450 [Nemania sp. FL0916]